MNTIEGHRVIKSCGSEFAHGKTIQRTMYREELPEGSELRDFAYNSRPHPDEAVYLEFTDGTGLLLVTNHTGPYSDLTPDVHIEVNLYAVTQ